MIAVSVWAYAFWWCSSLCAAIVILSVLWTLLTDRDPSDEYRWFQQGVMAETVFFFVLASLIELL